MIFAANGILVVVGRAYFGRKTPAEMIGKIMGINSMFVLIGVALGGYIYGFLFNRFPTDPGIVFLIISLATLLVASRAKVYK